MVMPRSRSSSMSSRNCADISRAETAPVRSRSRSASVDFPWSMCAMIEKLRMRSVSRASGLPGARPEPLDGAPEALGERDARTPSEPLGRLRVIDDAAPLLARLGRAVLHLGPAAGRLEHQLREQVHV